MNITKKSKNLEHLILDTCEGISVAALRKLSNLKNLVRLELEDTQGVDDSVIINIANRCKKLETFILLNLHEISTHGLQNIANLKNLEHLNISHTKLNRTTFIGITNNCTKLKNLYLTSCKNLPEDALKELGKLVNLEVLFVTAVENFTDSVLLGLQSQNLIILQCDFCRNVTDFGIKPLIENSPNLNFLFAHETKVTYRSLIHAVNKMIHRTNNCVLNITVNKKEAERFDQWKKHSDYLNTQNLKVDISCYLLSSV